ncbi:unnamed protein product [Orchesella dallaii]|uniref:Uncharacterized protein n=1 Tax=Orchesella dallaii TaxID=48710 RepID=A0ABP1PL05_9HEXA
MLKKMRRKDRENTNPKDILDRYGAKSRPRATTLCSLRNFHFLRGWLAEMKPSFSRRAYEAPTPPVAQYGRPIKLIHYYKYTPTRHNHGRRLEKRDKILGPSTHHHHGAESNSM